MKLEALTGGVQQSAFNNFAKFTVKHLRQNLDLIKLQAWWCATLSRKKLWHMCFPVRFSKLLRRPTLSKQMLE